MLDERGYLVVGFAAFEAVDVALTIVDEDGGDGSQIHFFEQGVGRFAAEDVFKGRVLAAEEFQDVGLDVGRCAGAFKIEAERDAGELRGVVLIVEGDELRKFLDAWRAGSAPAVEDDDLAAMRGDQLLDGVVVEDF